MFGPKYKSSAVAVAEIEAVRHSATAVSRSLRKYLDSVAAPSWTDQQQVMLNIITRDPIMQATIRAAADAATRELSVPRSEFYREVDRFARAVKAYRRSSLRSKLWRALQARGAIT